MLTHLRLIYLLELTRRTWISLNGPVYFYYPSGDTLVAKFIFFLRLVEVWKLRKYSTIFGGQTGTGIVGITLDVTEVIPFGN